MARKRTSKPVADKAAEKSEVVPAKPIELPAAEPTAEPDVFDRASAARAAGQFETPSTEATNHAAKEERKLPADPLAVFAKRDWNQFADPKPFHSVKFPDGYEIRVQESPSRRTVEIHFNQGRREDQPKNFAAIKEVLYQAGFRWNGTNAWTVDLVPERGSFGQREDARMRNKVIRAEIEERVFPAVIGLEEQARGQIGFTDEFRRRIAEAGAAR